VKQCLGAYVPLPIYYITRARVRTGVRRTRTYTYVYVRSVVSSLVATVRRNDPSSGVTSGPRALSTGHGRD